MILPEIAGLKSLSIDQVTIDFAQGQLLNLCFCCLVTGMIHLLTGDDMDDPPSYYPHHKIRGLIKGLLATISSWDDSHDPPRWLSVTARWRLAILASQRPWPIHILKGCLG